MRRILGFIDWRFIAALAGLILVAALVQSSLSAAEDRDRAIAQAVADRKANERERAEASAERQRLLQGQRDLEGKYERLVVWLNSQGIVVPESVLSGRRSRDDDSDDNDDGDDDSDSSPSSLPAPKPRETKKVEPPSDDGGQTSDSDKPGNGNGRGSDKSDRGNGKGSDKGSRGHGKAG